MTTFYLEIIQLLFIVGGFIALIIGLLLFFKPEFVARLSKSGNKWFSARRSTKPLDILRDTNTFYFKNNKVIGNIMLVVSLFALYLIYTRIPDADQYIKNASDIPLAIGVGILLESLRWILLVIIVMGLPVWGLLAYSPERLKIINTSLNRWISTRLLLLPLEEMNTGIDTFIVKYNRPFATFIVFGAIFILFKFLG